MLTRRDKIETAFITLTIATVMFDLFLIVVLCTMALIGAVK